MSGKVQFARVFMSMLRPVSPGSLSTPLLHSGPLSRGRAAGEARTATGSCLLIGLPVGRKQFRIPLHPRAPSDNLVIDRRPPATSPSPGATFASGPAKNAHTIRASALIDRLAGSFATYESRNLPFWTAATTDPRNGAVHDR